MTNEASGRPSNETMTAWDMATSILTGLRKAEINARAELHAIQASNPGKPYAPGIATATDILNTVSLAKLDIQRELSRIARSNQFTLPESQ